MKMITHICTAMVLLFVSAQPGEICYGQTGVDTNKKSPDETAIPFTIMSNQSSVSLPENRNIYILLEPQYFTEDCLKKVFTNLAILYDQPVKLKISAFSDTYVIKEMVYPRRRVVRLNSSETSQNKAGTNIDSNKPNRTTDSYFRAFYNRTQDGEESLLYSASADSKTLLKVILKTATPEAYTGDLPTDLKIAIAKSDRTKLELLLAQNIDKNYSYDYGYTPLFYAAEKGDLEVVKLLLRTGANINSQTFNGRTALIHCSSKGKIEIVNFLLEHNANVNLLDKNDMSALFHAVSYGHKEVAKALIKSGADANAKANDGKTALMLLFNNIETVQMLLHGGANINTTDHKGWTALMYAVHHLYDEKTEALLKSGADVNIRSSTGETALSIAKNYRGNKNIISLLKNAGAIK
jgi:ankyrin repeat protein